MTLPLHEAPTASWQDGVARGLSRLAPARPARLRLERPALSVSFDGFTRSAGERGARILDDHGVRGTFFASAGLIGAHAGEDAFFDPDLMLALDAAGHEIGDASYAHDRLSERRGESAVDDIERNAATLAAMGVKRPLRSFAYPYGVAPVRLKSRLPSRVLCARGRQRGLNHAWADLMELRAYPLTDAQSFLPINAALDRARRLRAWLIVYVGAVRDGGEGDATSAASLEALINVAKRAGFDIQPIGAVAARAAAAHAASAWM